MAVSLSLVAGAGWQFFDDNGDPLSGGKLFIYTAGTTTKVVSYTSSSASTPNANPIILDAAGRVVEEIWLTSGASYKFVLSPSTDTDPPTAAIWTKDNIPVSNDVGAVYTEFANTTDNAKGDALVGFKQANASGFLTGAVARTVSTKLQEFVSVKDFGAVGDGTTDDTVAIQAALNASSAVDFGDASNVYKISGSLAVTKPNSWLRGDGATIYAPANGAIVPALKAEGALSATTTNLTAGASPEAYSVAVTSSTGFAKGDWVLLSSANIYTSYETTSTFYAGEMLQIRKVVGNTVYFCTPVVGTYTIDKTPKITKVSFLNDINISGLKFKGTNTAGDINQGIRLYYVNGFSITNCEFLYQDFHQLNVTSSIRGTISDNRFTGVEYDGVTGSSFYSVVLIDATQWVNVENNIFNLGRAAVTTTKNAGLEYPGQPLFINILGNHMFDASAGGPGFGNCYQHHGFGRFINFSNNSADGGYAGIAMFGGEDVVISNNILTNVSTSGVSLGGFGPYLSRITVSGNYISRSLSDVVTVKYGVYLDETATITDIAITNNVIVNFCDDGGVGIYVGYGASSYGVQVANNFVSAGSASQVTTSNYGIVMGAGNSTVMNNTVSNYKNGIDASGNNVIASNNAVYVGKIGGSLAAAGTYGIYSSNADHVTLANNQVYNAYYAIHVGAGGTTGYPNIVGNVVDTCYVGVTTTANVVAPAVLNNFVRNASSAAYSLTSSTGAGGVKLYSGSATDSNASY